MPRRRTTLHGIRALDPAVAERIRARVREHREFYWRMNNWLCSGIIDDETFDARLQVHFAYDALIKLGWALECAGTGREEPHAINDPTLWLGDGI